MRHFSFSIKSHVVNIAFIIIACVSLAIAYFSQQFLPDLFNMNLFTYYRLPFLLLHQLLIAKSTIFNSEL